MGDGRWEFIEGRSIYGKSETVLRYEKLYSDVIERGGEIPYLDFLRQKYVEERDEFINVVSAYDVNKF
ncbi:hypothetical protein SNN51_001966 [Cronobacter turicensis]|nr:hypothetical protein [Cronobacter turicensis]